MNKKVISSSTITTSSTTSSKTTMTKKKQQSIVSFDSINNSNHEAMDQLFQTTASSTSPIEMIRTPSTSSPTTPLPSPSLSINVDDNNCTNDTNNLPLIIDNYANQLLLNNESNGNSSIDSHSCTNNHELINGTAAAVKVTKLFAEMEDLDDAQSLSVSEVPQPTGIVHAMDATASDASDSLDDVDHTAMRKKKLSLTLPLLNVVITDTTGTNVTKSPSPTAQQADASAGQQPSPANCKTKKFYESDDTFIQTIFSQTITSTTATPTDEFTNYPFDEFGAAQAPIVDQLTAASATVPAAVSQQPESLNDDTQTEKLDTYKETLISFSDIVNIDNECKDGLDSDNEDQYNQIYENLRSDEQENGGLGNDPNGIGITFAIDEAKTDTSTSLYENLDGCDNFDESNADDGDHIYENINLNENAANAGTNYHSSDQQLQQTPNQPLSSYFDQTIEEDDSYNEDSIGATTPPHGMTNNHELDDDPLVTNHSINPNANDDGNFVDNIRQNRCSASSSPPVNYDNDSVGEDAIVNVASDQNSVSDNRNAVDRLNGDNGDQQADLEAHSPDFDINVSEFL